MIGDNERMKPEYFQTAELLYNFLNQNTIAPQQKFVVGIAGESGSGKTITSLALKKVFESKGKNAHVVHLDDFFHLPPASNHAARLSDISRVGVSEVNLEKVNEIIANFKCNTDEIVQPLVNYSSNSIATYSWNAKNIEVLIVEGTYTLFMKELDARVFIDRSFIQTKDDRMARGRDIADEFVEQVLAIEHEIIQKQKNFCDLCIHSNFSISKLIKA